MAFQVPDEAAKAPSLQKTNNVNRKPSLQAWFAEVGDECKATHRTHLNLIFLCFVI